MENNIITINTDDLEPLKAEDCGDIFQNREEITSQSNENKVTIYLQAYNNIEKTKKCVEYLLKYTSHIDHELILADNGSTDGTIEFFKTVEHPKKTIFHFTKNLGSAYPTSIINSKIKSEFAVYMASDVYVTKNWLDNMLKCIESDIRIGLVMPMSSNMSNAQDPMLKFSNLEEMEQVAAKFNEKSDPNKWEERIRAFGGCGLRRRSAAILFGDIDVGFFHDFGDDDYCLRAFRAGYKQIVCGDTFVHHDHYQDGTNNEKIQNSLEKGRENFKQKYFGLDAWEDLINFEQNLLNIATYSQSDSNVLGIDTLCGVPLLEIRNRYKANGYNNTNLYGFTTNAKHYHDLQFVTDGKVQCDRIDFINDHYTKNAFDMVIIGEYINKYSSPIKVLETALDLLLPGGQLLIKLKNTLDVKTILGIVGMSQIFHEELYTHIMLDDFKRFITSYGVKDIKQHNILENIDENTKVLIKENLNKLPLADETACQKVFYCEYNFCITK